MINWLSKFVQLELYTLIKRYIIHKYNEVKK